MDRTSRHRSRIVLGVLAVAAGCATAVAGLGAGPAAGVTVTETVTVGSAANLAVQYRGNGHGHGMSQYGARGAARAGLSYQRILAFYYPGTSLVAIKHRIIRVKLAGTGPTTSIAALSNITLTGVTGYLPTAGLRRYRLIAGAGTTLTLQKLPITPGTGWLTVRTGLPNRAEFYRHGRVPLLVYSTDGTSTEYDGYVRAVRAPGGGLWTVNRVYLDNYVAGVVPREMPASWERAAVDAQAVAARTYALNSMLSPSSTEYDICATTQCQVYGGRAHYASDGTLLWSQATQPVADTSYRVLEYRGVPAFTQFSASNGGWTVGGGQPYLIARADPYDTPQRSFDPYIGATNTVRVSSLARYFRLAKVTSVTITSRDGNGTWRGRVLTGTVTGVDSAGHVQRVPASGYDFAGAFGLGTTWFTVAVAP